jgi:hypothetical protein
MAIEELKVNAGDRVVISRPRPNGALGARIERTSTVTAVRSKSFDAGGLCFRMDGREWGGHNRARMLTQGEESVSDGSLANDPDSSGIERAERAKEDAILAFLLSARNEKDWLKLGLHELRRIAALHGIPSARTEAVQVSNINPRE